MGDETEIGSAGASDRRRTSARRLANSVHRFKPEPNFSKTGIGSLSSASTEDRAKEVGAQHGTNSETGGACAAEWEALQPQTLTLAESIDQLRAFHRRAPFLFFNGNTFATIGRELALAILSDLPPIRKREASSAVAHYIAGVLDRDNMVSIVESLCEAASFQPGDRVKTLRGSTHGAILRLQDDGRVVWQPDGSMTELITLPESLVRAQAKP